ncbi:hypothetical protein QAD02_012618 [Eretmocerus hayati]|uniref:Uncharacterized protein n=1 Tax=Eretmocerus hayati TaxID=131215 RepID=A0ACC2P193_9HYME|nr:hypothetical protein QAD02_012618 [Eretmocerus hayati]
MVQRSAAPTFYRNIPGSIGDREPLTPPRPQLLPDLQAVSQAQANYPSEGVVEPQDCSPHQSDTLDILIAPTQANVSLASHKAIPEAPSALDSEKVNQHLLQVCVSLGVNYPKLYSPVFKKFLKYLSPSYTSPPIHEFEDDILQSTVKMNQRQISSYTYTNTMVVSLRDNFVNLSGYHIISFILAKSHEGCVEDENLDVDESHIYVYISRFRYATLKSAESDEKFSKFCNDAVRLAQIKLGVTVEYVVHEGIRLFRNYTTQKKCCYE